MAEQQIICECGKVIKSKQPNFLLNNLRLHKLGKMHKEMMKMKAEMRKQILAELKKGGVKKGG
ncbi:hypothetical protein ES703_112472 [subsurface metagenome]